MCFVSNFDWISYIQNYKQLKNMYSSQLNVTTLDLDLVFLLNKNELILTR